MTPTEILLDFWSDYKSSKNGDKRDESIEASAEQIEKLLKEKEEEAFKKGYKASTKEAKGAYNWNYSLLQEELEKKVKEKEADYRAEIVKKIEKLEPTRGGNADTFKEQIINIIKSK